MAVSLMERWIGWVFVVSGLISLAEHNQFNSFISSLPFARFRGFRDWSCVHTEGSPVELIRFYSAATCFITHKIKLLAKIMIYNPEYIFPDAIMWMQPPTRLDQWTWTGVNSQLFLKNSVSAQQRYLFHFNTYTRVRILVYSPYFRIKCCIIIEV